MPVLALSAYQR